MRKRTNNIKALVCDVCGKDGAQVRHVTRSFGKGARLLVIENVPVISCPRCGQSYMTATTLHEIEVMQSTKTHGSVSCEFVDRFSHRKESTKPSSGPPP